MTPGGSRGFPLAGPFHPKVLGLRLIATTPKSVATQRSTPKGWAPVSSVIRRPRTASTRRQLQCVARTRPRRLRHCPKAVGLDAPLMRHRKGASQNLSARFPKEPFREANRNSPEGKSDSWLRSFLQQAGVTGLGPDRHRLHRMARSESLRTSPYLDPKVVERRKRRGRGCDRATVLEGRFLTSHRSVPCRFGPKPELGAASRNSLRIRS